jgi:hypothetical protein
MSLEPNNGKKPTVPPTEEPNKPPPRVLYGYLRMINGDDKRATTLKADLLTFCRTHGFMLGTVFTDWGVEDRAIARPGFSSLLDVCRLIGSHGVLVPTQSHLSTHSETLATLTRQIQRTGAKLIAADDFEANLHGASDRPAKAIDSSAADDGAPC